MAITAVRTGCAVLAMLLASASTARADVVYGNLGPAGAGSLSSTNTDFGPTDPNERGIAQGFTVGSSSTLRTIESITLGLFVDGTAQRTVSIYSDNAGVPGTSLFTSSAVTVGTNDKYTFPFSGATLSTNTSYWIVPEGPSSWYFNTGPASAPTGQNASGYSYLGTKQLNTSSQWVNADFPFYSTSIVAVPEPHAMVLAAIGGVVAAFAARRRRG
jgi:hypothetical protein